MATAPCIVGTQSAANKPILVILLGEWFEELPP